MSAAQRPFDAVIFDMDGTLIELSLDFPRLRTELGVAPEEGILESLERRPAEQRREAQRRLEQYELAAAREAKLLPGAAEVLAAVRTAGLKTALLTRNTRQAIHIVLAKHPALRFDAVAGREDGPAKPDAKSVRNLCRILGVPPSKTLCVGDYHYDILAANTAGAVSVLLTTLRDRPGYSDWCGQARYRVDRLDKLIPILEL